MSGVQQQNVPISHGAPLNRVITLSVAQSEQLARVGQRHARLIVVFSFTIFASHLKLERIRGDGSHDVNDALNGRLHA